LKLATQQQNALQKNKEIVREYVEAILVQRDFSQFDKFAATGFNIDRSAIPEIIQGAGGLSKQMDVLYSAFPDLKVTVADMVAEDDKVVVRFEAPGTHTGDFVGIAPTGRSVK
jgi:predicted ester cyclase